MPGRRSIPFSVTILTLMALVVVPLTSVLLWLGWRSVDLLEQRSADQRVGHLESAVEDFLTDGLHVVISVGQTLAFGPSFNASENPVIDEQRRHQLIAMLDRHPAVQSAFVGYQDGSFIYAGRPETFTIEQRIELDAPDGESTIVRVIEAGAPPRTETYWFYLPDGSHGPARTTTSTFDARTRPWYVDAMKAKQAILTDPYRFVQTPDAGISAGIPLRTGIGVVGFDFTLRTLSELLTAYKITENSVIVVGHSGGAVEIESEPCAPTLPGCLPADAEVRQILHRAVEEAVATDARIDRQVEAGGHAYRVIVHRMPPLLWQRFVIAAAVPVLELTAESRVLLQRAAIAAAVAVALAALGALAASLILSRSITRIALKTERIRQLDFSDQQPVQSRITEIVRLSDAVENMRAGLEIFGRYVSKNLVQQIMRSPESSGVGGTRREITVMFTDIEGFSLLTETMEPELLTSRLSRYFEALGSAISANRGMIDKYIGDSIMSFWNAPETDPEHIANACRGALQAAAAGHALSEKWRERGRPGFRTRFGVHTGPAVVGNVGARERINYTLVGQVANQASRLEGMNKVYGTEILASGEVAQPTSALFVWRHIDRVVAVGTTEAHDVYEPMGEAASRAEHAAFLVKWEKAREAYVAGRFEEALAGFQAAAAMREEDPPSHVFIGRCERFLREGVPAEWDGTWYMDRK
ncbi:adenylate/guanylate cyclase domain-containing protein [Reyranella sp.]|jgi:adenylate cyclase|uniref:adenylate/guanylate cyclase domain-containing protein n=1 Tax=Reyranella sp. TaxID=1929291 RepID=UPI002618ED2D|nr:adenylate/guanylate cyclase domain-containing protein [Reyranella sp.]HQS15485.1 adenylate/guanylate cyclase domain-containing protein [Reyranella sp.]HQT12011.1 adenylate/guanylate cyclase domain-containing protein [Reyranella sp.]